jgi:hypothetical protein
MKYTNNKNNISKILKVYIINSFNATFNTSSIVLRWAVLLMEESDVPGEKTPPVVGHYEFIAE